MNLQDKLLNFLPFLKKEEAKEYFFALNIGQQNLEAALWMLSGKHLQILQTATSSISSLEEITNTTDKLLDTVLGIKEIEPQKILFGVPDDWLSEDDLKEEYLKLLRNLVKNLELSPMAYVATSHALLHFLENQEGVPTTAILIGFEEHNLVVTVSRAGKLDGSKVLKRSENIGLDIEKALLTFTNIETLPSKILIYGLNKQKLENLKGELLPFPWMSKLSFLHFPKIDIIDEDLEIKSICLAGAKEINPDVVFDLSSATLEKVTKKIPETHAQEPKVEESPKKDKGDLGFVVGDIQKQQESEGAPLEQKLAIPKQQESEQVFEAEDFEQETQDKKGKFMLSFASLLSLLKRFPTLSIQRIFFWVGILVLISLLGSFLLLPKAQVKIFVEPQVLEKDAEVIADPKVKEVDEEAKIIPGQTIETEVSGSGKGGATGKKEIGDPARGKVVIFNATSREVSLSKGILLVDDKGTKFSLDMNVQIASKSASAAASPTQSDAISASAEIIGADGNIPSGTELRVGNFTKSEVVAKAEGNFSGGTSKQATVVSETDQSRLLAQVAADLRKQAQQKLQESLRDKKILEEALSEEVVKKSFSKNVSDQASDFSLNLTVRYKGTAFEDKDLKLIVSKLVNTQVPEGFELNLSETETQADVSKLEKDGRLVFLARFRAKLIPKLDLDKIKYQIRGKTPNNVAKILKEHSHILGSEIVINPTLPSFLQLVPFFERNIKVEVGLK